jgi:hypothetical protein
VRYFGLDPKGKGNKNQNRQWDYITLRNFCSAKENNQQTEEWTNDLKRHFSKEDIQMTNKQEKCSIPLINRELASKPQ